MEQTLEHRIRQRAYEIWNAHGQSDGRADEHWLAAEREILCSLKTYAPAPNAGASSKPRKAASGSTAGQRATRSRKSSARG